MFRGFSRYGRILLPAPEIACSFSIVVQENLYFVLIISPYGAFDETSGFFLSFFSWRVSLSCGSHNRCVHTVKTTSVFFYSSPEKLRARWICVTRLWFVAVVFGVHSRYTPRTTLYEPPCNDWQIFNRVWLPNAPIYSKFHLNCPPWIWAPRWSRDQTRRFLTWHSRIRGWPGIAVYGFPQ